MHCGASAAQQLTHFASAAKAMPSPHAVVVAAVAVPERALET
jgi:hypothetical protein